MSTKHKLWFTGILLATAGVALVRGVAGHVTTPELQFAINIVGILIAIGGLAVILMGLRSKN